MGQIAETLLRSFYKPDTLALFTSAFSPNGRYLASGSRDFSFQNGFFWQTVLAKA
jgi:hypothetical protein